MGHFYTQKKSESIPHRHNDLDSFKTLNSTFHETSLNNFNNKDKFKTVLKSKLSYEWKSIFRMLSSIDTEGTGYVSKRDFEEYSHKCGTFLTREDVKKIA